MSGRAIINPELTEGSLLGVGNNDGTYWLVRGEDGECIELDSPEKIDQYFTKHSIERLPNQNKPEHISPENAVRSALNNPCMTPGQVNSAATFALQVGPDNKENIRK